MIAADLDYRGAGLSLIVVALTFDPSLYRRRIEPVHHRLDPVRHEHLGRVGRPRRHRLDVRGLVASNAGQHVIGKVAPRITSSDADPQPRELLSEVRPTIDFSPLCPPADPRGRARSRASGSCTSSTIDQQIDGVDLEVPQQSADRLAAAHS